MTGHSDSGMAVDEGGGGITRDGGDGNRVGPSTDRRELAWDGRTQPLPGKTGDEADTASEGRGGGDVRQDSGAVPSVR